MLLVLIRENPGISCQLCLLLPSRKYALNCSSNPSSSLKQQETTLDKTTDTSPHFFFCRVNDSNWLPGETEKHQSSNTGAEGLQSQEEGRKEREGGERQLGLAPGLVDRLGSTAGSKWGLQQPEGSAGNPLTWPTGYCWGEKQELSILPSL